MQKAGIVQSQQRADHRVVFVARAGDGVKTLVAFLQFARRDIEQTACDLIFKSFQSLCNRQPAAWPQRIVFAKTTAGWFGCRQIVLEVALYNFNACDWG
ncbi:MAG: hypothetical protein JMDDDDMK_05318 [Acidobacteria bacterium]|nr:hypothetical protein [Acidobacteriota bacterium]